VVEGLIAFISKVEDLEDFVGFKIRETGFKAEDLEDYVDDTLIIR
jgi:hypothetical protein